MLSSLWNVQLPKQQADPENGRSLLSGYNGPIASVLRIGAQVVYQPWIPWVLSLFTDRGAARKFEEAKTRARTAIELLIHSGELGHTDSWYTLADLYLVRSKLEGYGFVN